MSLAMMNTAPANLTPPNHNFIIVTNIIINTVTCQC